MFVVQLSLKRPQLSVCSHQGSDAEEEVGDYDSHTQKTEEPSLHARK